MTLRPSSYYGYAPDSTTSDRFKEGGMKKGAFMAVTSSNNRLSLSAISRNLMMMSKASFESKDGVEEL